MKRIRIRVIILISWLVAFYLITGLFHLIALSYIALLLVFFTAIVMLAVPHMVRVSLWLITLIPIGILLGGMLWMGNLSDDLLTVSTVLVISAIAITVIFSRWVSLALTEFENSVANISLGQRDPLAQPAIPGQGSIYREVRRARNHQRPLALISISIDENSIVPQAERLVQEIQLSMSKQYALAGLSKMLCAELEDCAVITQNEDHYLAALPDTTIEDVPYVVERLRQKACKQVGVEIKIGVATLPRDSYTFDGLVEKATEEMIHDREPQPCVVKEEYPLETAPSSDPAYRIEV